MHFRWRDNAGIIAQYILDSKIPRAAEVTLKPNEVCVILEDGRVVGSVSQQHMELIHKWVFEKLFGRATQNGHSCLHSLGSFDLIQVWNVKRWRGN